MTRLECESTLDEKASRTFRLAFRSSFAIYSYKDYESLVLLASLSADQLRNPVPLFESSAKHSSVFHYRNVRKCHILRIAAPGEPEIKYAFSKI